MDVIKKIEQDIKDYVRSLNTPDNEVYKNNELLILSCFSKCLEIIEQADVEGSMLINPIITNTLTAQNVLLPAEGLAKSVCGGVVFMCENCMAPLPFLRKGNLCHNCA